MEILIDSQKVVDVEVEMIYSRDDGEDVAVLGIESVFTLLEAWRELDPSRRFFSWPATRDAEDMIVAWYSEASGLVHQWVSPFWDGREEYEAHRLSAIDESLPVGALEYEPPTPDSNGSNQNGETS